METEEIINGKVHHGHNIRRVRTEKGIKQESIAKMMHLAQSTISKYENTRRLEDEVLNHFARTLNVPVELLKTLEEDAPTFVFENITNNGNAAANATIGYLGNVEDKRVSNINSIEKVTELYERLLSEKDLLLKDKDEKYAALERRLESVMKGQK